jgi:hypothetical protein
MAYKIKLTYQDGEIKEVLPSARARIETERHFGGLGPQNAQEATFYMAWAHLKKTGEAKQEFEEWIDTLVDIEETKVDDVRPTQPAQPTATSSD